MKDTWKQINTLRHDLGNEKNALHLTLNHLKKMQFRILSLEKKIFRLIEKVEKLEG